MPPWWSAPWRATEDGFRNAALVIDADGEFTDRFEKVRRVPFGEYVPFRSTLSRFAGDALPARDAIVGEGPATVETDVGTFGVVISWEVFFANRARDAIRNGGEVLLNPTNGSSYWLTIVQTQQVASSRLRAMETGRWVLQAAPTGLTAIITPDGEVLDRTAVSERAVVQGTVETRAGLTIYTRVGDWPMLVLALGLVLGAWLVFGRSSASGQGNRPQTSSRTVVGPSLTSSTSMSVRKRPVATVAPWSRNVATTRSTSGSACSGAAASIHDGRRPLSVLP